MTLSSPPLPTQAAQDAPNDATNYIFFDDRDALVLSGGGARGAYQVGVLKAIAEWLPEDAPCPFEVLVGTSAGALNAAAIGARAHSLREAVQSLEAVWANFRVEQVDKSGQDRTDVRDVMQGQHRHDQIETMIRNRPGGKVKVPHSSIGDGGSCNLGTQDVSHAR